MNGQERSDCVSGNCERTGVVVAAVPWRLERSEGGEGGGIGRFACCYLCCVC